jgi:hypothetical protein
VVTASRRASISDGRYGLLAPVTGATGQAFVPMRRTAVSEANVRGATVGDGADETVTSEGRCPR